MEPVKEITRFLYDVTKLSLIIVAVILVSLILYGIFEVSYQESIYACPERRVIFTDNEAILFAKNYIKNVSEFQNTLSSIDYNSSRKSDRSIQYGWGVKKIPASNRFQAESLIVDFWGREDDTYVGCWMLACGVIRGCSKTEYLSEE